MLYYTTLNDEKKEIIIEDRDSGFRIKLNDEWHDVDCESLADGLYLSLLIGGNSYTVETRRKRNSGDWLARFEGDYLEVAVRTELEERAAEQQEEEESKGPVLLQSPMPGVVIKISVEVGETIKAGQTIAVVEAMKMQNELSVERDGVVSGIHVSAGDGLETRALIATIDPLPE